MLPTIEGFLAKTWSRWQNQIKSTTTTFVAKTRSKTKLWKSLHQVSKSFIWIVIGCSSYNIPQIMESLPWWILKKQDESDWTDLSHFLRLTAQLRWVKSYGGKRSNNKIVLFPRKTKRKHLMWKEPKTIDSRIHKIHSKPNGYILQYLWFFCHQNYHNDSFVQIGSRRPIKLAIKTYQIKFKNQNFNNKKSITINDRHKQFVTVSSEPKYLFIFSKSLVKNEWNVGVGWSFYERNKRDRFKLA